MRACTAQASLHLRAGFDVASWHGGCALLVQPTLSTRVTPRGKPPEGAVSTNGSNGSTERSATSGRAWGLWAIGAAIPLSVGGFVLYWIRQRTRALTAGPDPFEAWWQERHRVRESGNGHGNGNGNGSSGKRTEGPRARPDGSNPMFV